MSKIQIGDAVIVTDPKHRNSTHEHSFAGVVQNVDALGYDVQDQNGNVWSVMKDEIEYVGN